MVLQELIDNHQWNQITQITKDAIQTMLNLKVHHISISSNDHGKELGALVGKSQHLDTDSSTMIDCIEMISEKNTQQLPCICLSTKNMERAIFFLQKKGYSFDQNSAVYNQKNKIKAIYFNELISGHHCCLQEED